MKRRDFIKAASLTSVGYCLTAIASACNQRPKHILVVSGWQDVNIGDIAHTPGLLNIIKTNLPDCRITLWKKSKGEEVELMLKNGFPSVKIIHGEVDRKSKVVKSTEVLEAFEDADIMIHGSGPGLVGRYHLEAWQKYTKKPFGIFGITIASTNDALNAIFSSASFVFVRETASLRVLAEEGVQGAYVGFSPDATFYFNLHDDERAQACLEHNGMQKERFICVVPRLRYTPYHRITPGAKHWSGLSGEEIDEINNRWKELDHGKLREVMVSWVRQTGNNVLVCPEMTYQVDIMDELLIDPLPEDVKPFVAKRGYWLPDEAASVYRDSFAVVSFECHSPILAAANNTPFIYLRQPEDTIKGQMYHDLELSDWVCDIDVVDGKQIAEILMKAWNDRKEAKDQLNIVSERINGIYQNACTKIRYYTDC